MIIEELLAYDIAHHERDLKKWEERELSHDDILGLLRDEYNSLKGSDDPIDQHMFLGFQAFLRKHPEYKLD